MGFLSHICVQCTWRTPPPPPRACFGREELIEKVDFVENLAPVALTCPGGIGKTSVALTVLRSYRLKRRLVVTAGSSAVINSPLRSLIFSIGSQK